MLPGPCSSTNFLVLKFPIICTKIGRGENIFYLDSTKLGEYLDLKNVDVESLSATLCDGRIRLNSNNILSMKTDPLKRALEYRSLIENGIAKNQSDLAAHLGTSRAWISKVMKILRNQTK